MVVYLCHFWQNTKLRVFQNAHGKTAAQLVIGRSNDHNPPDNIIALNL
jgi:hypothetical protein